jgi:adenylate cyclase
MPGEPDYLAMALPRCDRMINRCSFATDRPEGFSDREIERLVALRPALALVLELKGQARMTQQLLDLYLGPEAGNRVWRGQIKRGEGATFRSVLWMSDLRRFTRLSEELPLEALTAVLDDYFDAVIGPIQAHGGEVLKLMGDGVLGVFRIEEDDEIALMSEAALNAAELALANMGLLNRRRARQGKPLLECGIALHVGDVMYGNVGAQNRLDFTVIGPAVNLCARLEDLVGELGERILCSAEFVSHADRPMRSVGFHPLKSPDSTFEAFAPAQTGPR